MIYHICCSNSIHLMLHLLQWMWLVVDIGHLMCFNRWIHCFIGLNDDINCDLFIEWIHWMIWFQMGTLCDLSLSWIHLMVLELVVKPFEWHPKLNVLWVFKWKPSVWVVGFGLVDSLALVPFNLHISFHLFHLIYYSWINLQTFGTRLKWGWLNKTPIFDHFPVDSTSHLQNAILQTIRALASTFKTHISWRSGNSIKIKTSLGQPNPGFPLFRRQS
jgi:hypothetical protein